MAKKTMIKDLTKGSVTKLLLIFAFPVMLSNLLQTAYNMIDMIIVGQYVGSFGLSSVSIGGDVLHFYTFIGMGFATAGQIIVSQYIGAGRKEDLNQVIGTLFTFIFLLSSTLAVFSFISADSFLSLLNTPSESYEGAKAYLLCCSAGMFFIFGYNVISAVFRGMGDSKRPLMFIGFASIVNIILDYIFIAIMEMGTFGAALATVIGQGSSFILSILYLYRHRDSFCFDFKLTSFAIDKASLKTIIKLGIPVALQSSAGSISSLFVGSYVNSYGVITSAVTGVGAKLNSIALIVANALNTSGAAMIGQCFGAGKLDRVKQVVYRVFTFDFIFVSILSVGILSFPEAVFSLFNSDPDVLLMSSQYAPVAAVSFMGFAFRSPSLALINGLGHSKINFLMGLVEGIILRIGLTVFLGITLNLGIQGFWYGSTIASYGYGLVVFPYFFSGAWKKRKTVIQH